MMGKELDEGKKERERLVAFEKDVLKRREEAAKDGSALSREGLEREIAKVGPLPALGDAELTLCP